MTRFWRLLQYARKYKKLILVSILCNILTALFPVVSAPAIIPFLQILVGLEQPILDKPVFYWDLDGIRNYANFQLGTLIQEKGKSGTLILSLIHI